MLPPAWFSGIYLNFKQHESMWRVLRNELLAFFYQFIQLGDGVTNRWKTSTSHSNIIYWMDDDVVSISADFSFTFFSPFILAVEEGCDMKFIIFKSSSSGCIYDRLQLCSRDNVQSIFDRLQLFRLPCFCCFLNKSLRLSFF